MSGTAGLSFEKIRAHQKGKFRNASPNVKSLRFAHEPRDIYRNGMGWEIRCNSPFMAMPKIGGCACLRRLANRVWRWDVFDADGRFVASEPTFYHAMEIASLGIMLDLSHP